MPSHRTTLHPSRHQGFTLIELMVVLAIIAIVALVAAPSYTSSTEASRESSALNQLLGALQFARSEAAAGADPDVEWVGVCAKSGTSCGTDWSAGGIVVTDKGDVLRSIPPFANVAITGNRISFKRSGQRDGNNDTLSVQVGSRAAKTISVNAIGFAKID